MDEEEILLNILKNKELEMNEICFEMNKKYKNISSQIHLKNTFENAILVDKYFLKNNVNFIGVFLITLGIQPF